MKLYCIGSAGGYPMDKNGTTSYVVTSSDNQFRLLLDAGSGSAMAIEDYLPVNELNAVWLSHDHPDHSADIGIFQHLFFLKKPASKQGTIPIYMNENSKLLPIMMNDETTEVRLYKINEALEIGPFRANFLRTTHPIECAAIRLEEIMTGKVLVFTGDSGWQDSLVDFAQEADVLLADTNFTSARGQNAVHMTSIEVARLANAAKVKHLIVTHIPPQADAVAIMSEVKNTISENIQVSQAMPKNEWNF